MVDLMVKMNWDHVTLFYSDDAYGKESLHILKEELSSHYICVRETRAESANDVNIIRTSTSGSVYVGTAGIGRLITDACNMMSL